MSVQQKMHGATKRGALVLLLVCSFSIFAFAGTPVATGLSALVSGPTTRITIHGTAPMAYSVKRPDAFTLVIDLPSVDASRLAREYNFASPLVFGAAIESSLKTGATARLHFNLKVPVRDRSQLSENDLVLELSASGPEGAPSYAVSDTLHANAPLPTATPAAPERQYLSRAEFAAI